MATDNFWDDCRNELPIEHNKLRCKYKNAYEILLKNERMKWRCNKKVHHCNIMYTNAIKKREKDKMNKRYQRLSDLPFKEVIECTWKPNIIRNKTVDDRLKHYNDIPIYQRGLRTIHRHNENIIQKNIKNRLHSTIEVKFKPVINSTKNMKKMFSRNIDNEYKEDYSKKRFMMRYQKAKKDSELQTRSLYTIKPYEWNNNKIKQVNRSLSAKESFILKQTLHDELISTGACDD